MGYYIKYSFNFKKYLHINKNLFIFGYMKLIITKNETQNSKLNRYVKNLKRSLAIMSMDKFKKQSKDEIENVKRQLSNPELWYKVYVTEIIK